MAIAIPNSFNAYGSVDGATGALTSGSGFSPSRVSAGVYTISLLEPVSSGQVVVIASLRGAGGSIKGALSVEETTNSVKTVRYNENGVATDVSFDILVLNTPAGIIAPAPVVTDDFLVTESGNFLVTESGDFLVTE